MIQLIFKLLLTTAFLVVLVQTQPTTPSLEMPPGLASLGDSNNIFKIPSCVDKECAAGRVCIIMGLSAECVIPKGKPCTFHDLCEGGYYCLSKKTCSGSGYLPLNSPCRGTECDNGLYCDISVKKCRPIGI